ncbi:MAG: hypothetical protein Tsb002_27340 [Wenzhouxiangellaceae bacterium]
MAAAQDLSFVHQHRTDRDTAFITALLCLGDCRLHVFIHRILPADHVSFIAAQHISAAGTQINMTPMVD